MVGARPRWMMLAGVCLMAILIMAQPARAAIVIDSGLRTIDADEFQVIKSFTALEDAGISFEVQVTYGPNVDVLLMDGSSYQRYQDGDPDFSYEAVSKLDLDWWYANTSAGGLIQGTTYYLVVDNTDLPAGGALPNGQTAQIWFEFGGANVSVPGDGAMFMILVGAAAAAAIVIVLVLLLLLRSKRAPGEQRMKFVPPLQPGVRVCPRCGAQASSEFAYCPDCGARM